jgi:hypothetical protein
MRLRHKILVIILLFLIIGYSSLYFFVGIAGKDILAAKMKDAIGREVKVGSVNLVFPLSIIVRDVEIPGLVKISEVFAGGGALDIFRRNFILSELRLSRVVVSIEKLKKEAPPQPLVSAPVIPATVTPAPVAPTSAPVAPAPAVSSPAVTPPAPEQPAPAVAPVTPPQEGITQPPAPAPQQSTPAAEPATASTMSAPAATVAPTEAAPQPPVTVTAPSEPPALPAQVAQPAPPANIAEHAKAEAPRRKLPSLTLKHFRITDSTFNFTDKSVKGGATRVTIEDLNVHIENLVFPIDESNIVSFDISGKMPWLTKGKTTQGHISATGWVNLYKRDMQAKLEIKDIDAISLYPYYSKWVDLEKARIQQARLNFNSDISGINGDVKAECHLELTDLVFRPKEANEKEQKAHRIATAVLSMFNEFGGKVAVDFTFKTRMEKPDFNLESIRTAVEDKLKKAQAAKGGEESVVESAVTFPVKLLEGGVRSGTDLSRALIDGVFTIGKSVRNGVHGLVTGKDSP